MVQERIKKDYKSIKLPNIFIEEDRGFFRCCEPILVLASSTNDTWKNDITPVWQKLSSPSDVFEVTLLKCGEAVNYTAEILNFVKDENAYYSEIHWKDVLASDGIGHYSIQITSSIAGIEFNYTWGEYELKVYSNETAKGTARLRAVFNSFQEIEGIDFTDSAVNGTIRFKGMFGFKNPNKQTDNLIYNNRQMKSVVRENLNTYELKTDPLKEYFLKEITDLYLLSENQLFASDHNPHNNSYNYFDLPVTIEESDKIDYYELSRYGKLSAVLTDRNKNKRTFFN